MSEAIHDTRFESLIRCVRLARQLEIEGHYNAAKLLWAAAFSEEIHASSEAALLAGSTDLDRDLEVAIAEIGAGGASPEVITALVIARKAVRESRTIQFEQIPQVHVCRSCGFIVLGDAPVQCRRCGAFELTFREFPAVHYLVPLPPAQALDALEAVPELLHALIDSLSDDLLALAPAPGEWSIEETLQHFDATGHLLDYRVRRMLAEPHPLLKAVSVPKGENATAARDILATWEASRLALVELLRTIAQEDWFRTGEHQEFGPVTIVQQVSYFARHDHAHLTQIEHIRRAIGA